jgi:hypothetical protein
LSPPTWVGPIEVPAHSSRSRLPRHRWPSCSGRRSLALPDAVPALAGRKVVLLENIRFDPRETSEDDAERGALADELAALTRADGA